MTQSKRPRLYSYRQKHRRYDYYASPDVADIIAHYRATGTETCIAGIIDSLIREGHKFVSGNGVRK
jgi:hypothetical protein